MLPRIALAISGKDDNRAVALLFSGLLYDFKSLNGRGIGEAQVGNDGPIFIVVKLDNRLLQ